MPRKSRKQRKQKLYKMKGCAKNGKTKSKRGGASFSLAYTGSPVPPLPPNPYMAYTGDSNVNKAYPNTGSHPPGSNVLSLSTGGLKGGCNSCGMTGGGCGCGAPLMTGGNCGPVCGGVPVSYGGRKHRVGCKCSSCKKKRASSMKGGAPYSNGLVGSALNPADLKTLPGVNNIPGSSNHYPLNTYPTDVQRAMQAAGSNPSENAPQKGGAHIMPEFLVNASRYVPYTIGSVYNGLLGYQQPVNPLPWKDQFPNSNDTLIKLSRI